MVMTGASLAGFVLLAHLAGNFNGAIQKVIYVDYVGLVVLGCRIRGKATKLILLARTKTKTLPHFIFGVLCVTLVVTLGIKAFLKLFEEVSCCGHELTLVLRLPEL